MTKKVNTSLVKEVDGGVYIKCCNCQLWLASDLYANNKASPTGKHGYCKQCNALRRGVRKSQHFSGETQECLIREAITSRKMRCAPYETLAGIKTFKRELPGAHTSKEVYQLLAKAREEIRIARNAEQEKVLKRQKTILEEKHKREMQELEDTFTKYRKEDMRLLDIKMEALSEAQVQKIKDLKTVQRLEADK